jgi:hypothetical protein
MEDVQIAMRFKDLHAVGGKIGALFGHMNVNVCTF